MANRCSSEQWHTRAPDLREQGHARKVGAACAGYVVQKVTVKCVIKGCSCGPCEIPDDEKEYDTFEYWEAWEVKRGDTSVLDNAHIPTWNKRCGRYVQTGVVKFYCGNRQNVPDGTGDKVGTGPLQQGWRPGEFGGKKNRECGTKTGFLPGTDDPKKVPFWDKLPVEEGEGEGTCTARFGAGPLSVRLPSLATSYPGITPETGETIDYHHK